MNLRTALAFLLVFLPAGAATGDLSAAEPGGRPAASAPAIHMIGHAHIDPVWRWTMDEGQAEVLATFRSAVARLKEYPDVAFISSSAQFYQWVREADPALFAEIKSLVKQGRWNPVGGWWVEADTNCPSGESLVRQGLFGQRFFRENFGAASRVGFNPDAFGHPWTLPQILAGQGLDSYFFMRPNPEENPAIRPGLFQWRGPDGTKVLAVRIGSYNSDETSVAGLVSGYERFFSHFQPGQKTWAVFYGVGDHGGGPTKAVIEKIRSMNKSDPRIRFSTLDAYLAAMEPGRESLPVVDGELQHHARGCYSACAPVKAWNRESEWALITAEKLASVGSAFLGTAYPADRLRPAWERVLFNQFHDILAGSAIEQAYREARDDYGYALSVARDVRFKSLQRLAREVDTSAGSASGLRAPFLAFNPQAWRASGPVEVEMERRSEAAPRLVRFDGREVPYQEVRTAGVKVGSRIRVAFEDEFPSFGYSLYYLDFGAAKPAAPARRVRLEGNVLENDFARVVFDETSGAIRSYYDKAAGRELLAAPARAIVLTDPGDTWGHHIDAYDKEVGRFGAAKFRVVESGPVRARLQVETSFGRSVLLQDYVLYASGPDLRCRATVDWHEFYKVLKLGFPTRAAKGTLTYSIPYGFIERPMDGKEEPGQTWVDVSGRDDRGAFGVALLNDSKCGYSVKGGEVRLTVLRSPAWSHHVPQAVDEREGYRLMDIGTHEFSYALLPHAGDWREGDVARRAESFGMPAMTILTDAHPGAWPGSRELLLVSSPQVSATVVKLAERGNALAVRLVELHGREASGEIACPLLDKPYRFKIGPCQIKTILLPFEKGRAPRETNLLED